MQRTSHLNTDAPRMACGAAVGVALWRTALLRVAGEGEAEPRRYIRMCGVGGVVLLGRWRVGVFVALAAIIGLGWGLGLGCCVLQRCGGVGRLRH